MLGITRREFINYTLLPGIMPRLKEMFASGFQHIPFFMALVYQSVRLLPANHPYTNPANLGRFGVRHVIAEAANNLVISRNNIDQIFVFICLMVGLILVFIQVLMLAFSFFAGTAMAGVTSMPAGFSGFFTIDPSQDLAAMLGDLIFGIPGNNGSFFGSCFGDPLFNGPTQGCLDHNGNPITDGLGQSLMGTLGFPLPIHQGLHAMFNMYNTGLMVVAFMITLYFITTVFLETAQTGTPFGKRFNKVWAPVRLVVAFGLLIPFGVQAGGLNSSQYIVLYAAKLGSAFASNGWQLFNNTLSGTYTGQAANLVSQPNAPEMSGLYQFLFSAATCAEIERYHGRQIHPYLVKDPVSTISSVKVSETDYKEAVEFANGDRQLVIRFGEKGQPPSNQVTTDDTTYSNELGRVKPFCGELVIPLTDSRVPNSPNPPERTAVIMQAYYYQLVYELYFFGFQNIPFFASARPLPELLAANPGHKRYAQNFMLAYSPWGTPLQKTNVVLPDNDYKQAVQQLYEKDIEALLAAPVPVGPTLSPAVRGLNANPYIGTESVITAAINSNIWIAPDTLKQKGWAAAGIWYNKIAEMNGTISAAVLSAPIPTRYPEVMERVRAEKQKNQNFSVSERFKPDVTAGDIDAVKANVLWEAFNYWQTGGGATSPHTAATGNPILDFLNGMFGTSGLYSMRKNVNVHPLAQLVGVGRSLVEAATRNLKLSLLITIGGAASGDAFLGDMATVGITLLMTIVITALTVGFILYYVLPFMPFIYFFFAVGGWFKAIFEAMVGAPLWALAHLRIDGPGLPGQAAVGGYFLIFEIFLRPILIVFGLLASVSIFSAVIGVMNTVWDLVTSNLSGFDVQSEASGFESAINYLRGPIDEFFFTVIYAVVVYIMSLSCFKLIDKIPGNILRWMGQSVKVFVDEEDHGATLSGTAAIGANQALSGVGGKLTEAMRTMAKSK